MWSTEQLSGKLPTQRPGGSDERFLRGAHVSDSVEQRVSVVLFRRARTARDSNIGTFPICAQTAFVLTNKSAYEELPELKASEQVLNAYWKRLPAEGLEPTRSCDHWILSPARLPVPPRRLAKATVSHRMRSVQVILSALL